jgi:hypothetical protein
VLCPRIASVSIIVNILLVDLCGNYGKDNVKRKLAEGSRCDFLAIWFLSIFSMDDIP